MFGASPTLTPGPGQGVVTGCVHAGEGSAKRPVLTPVPTARTGETRESAVWDGGFVNEPCPYIPVLARTRGRVGSLPERTLTSGPARARQQPQRRAREGQSCSVVMVALCGPFRWVAVAHVARSTSTLTRARSPLRGDAHRPHRAVAHRVVDRAGAQLTPAACVATDSARPRSTSPTTRTPRSSHGRDHSLAPHDARGRELLRLQDDGRSAQGGDGGPRATRRSSRRPRHPRLAGRGPRPFPPRFAARGGCYGRRGTTGCASPGRRR